MQLEDSLAILRAAGEGTRLRLLALLAETDLTVSDLTEILNQSQPRISRHLKLLHEAGLIERYREGAFIYHSLPRSDEAAKLLNILLKSLDASDVQLVHDRERLEKARAARGTKAEEYFAGVAEEWDRLRNLHVSEKQVESAIEKIAKSKNIESHLDIGTGTGRLLELFAKHTQRSVGIDVSHAMLSVARANLERSVHKHVQVRPGDVYALPFAPGSFDLVTLHQVLHYLEEPVRALGEAARVLKPGGRLLIVDFAPHGNEFLREKFAHRILGFSHEQMQRWLNEAGLRLAKVQDLKAPRAKRHALTVSIWLAETQGEPRSPRFERRLEGALA
jgi:ubiquinone/menaquinone biosynthesis C-methylase UbiE/DNA-binding transcriptional ArsR family regulator